jgi:hypothetical protein
MEGTTLTRRFPIRLSPSGDDASARIDRLRPSQATEAPPTPPGSVLHVGVLAPQVTHAASLAPQTSFMVPGWQLVPLQQPVPQLPVALQTQAPPLQMGVVAGHGTHTRPSEPQAVALVPV